jgi:outer membrane lipoprotein SlyB
MGFFRSLIGGTIGLALGGPIGAVAGAIIANDTAGGCPNDGSDVGE